MGEPNFMDSKSLAEHESSPPIVSVVIPAFNAENTLAETVESVLAQTLQSIEVIIVDDGSTDTTQHIAFHYVNRDTRVKVIVQANSGVADARNAGIYAAKAPYIAPIDADDLWHPTFLEKLYAALFTAGEKTLFAFANFRFMNDQGTVVGDSSVRIINLYAFNRFMIKNFVGNGSGMMFRRDAAVAVNGYDRRLQHEYNAVGCEDYLMQLRLSFRGHVISVNEFLVGYRLTKCAMSSNKLRMLKSRHHAYEILLNEVQCSGSVASKWALGNYHAERVKYELIAGNINNALKTFIKAVKIDTLGSLNVFIIQLVKFLRKKIRSITKPLVKQRHFYNYDPTENLNVPISIFDLLLAYRLKKLAKQDRIDGERIKNDFK